MLKYYIIRDDATALLKSKGGEKMARGTKVFDKNKWTLFLLILLGIVVGSFIAHLAKDVSFLRWLNYSMDFALGDSKENPVVSLNLAVLVINFGLRLKISIGSVIGAIVSIIIYKKV